MILFLVAICIRCVFSDDKTNIIQITKNEEFEDKLKIEFGCNPPNEFKLIKQNHNDGYVENICLPKSYQVMKPPNVTTKVGVLFHEKRILQINERRRSTTLVISLLSFWEDARIKISDYGNESSYEDVFLPDVKNTHHYIWAPFINPDVFDIREMTNLRDRELSQVGVTKGEYANHALGMNLFSSNTTVFYGRSDWKAKVFCRFDFSKYPFDKQKCVFAIITFDLNVTVCKQKEWGYKRESQSDFAGYDLSLDYFQFESPEYDSVFMSVVGVFGFGISMNRQLETYFYQYYIPCMAIVITSIFSFIVPLTAIPGRVMIVVTQFLTLTNLFSSAMVSKRYNVNRIIYRKHAIYHINRKNRTENNIFVHL